MAQAQMQAQFGAWVEGATARKDGKGNRKEWVTDPRKVAGERVRLSVIATEGERQRHVLTLAVDTSEARAEARTALLAALKALDVADRTVPVVAQAAPKPAPAPAKTPAPVVPPAAPTRTPRTTDAKGKPTLLGQIGKPAQATTHKPAPAKLAPAKVADADLGWFASLMADA